MLPVEHSLFKARHHLEMFLKWVIHAWAELCHLQMLLFCNLSTDCYTCVGMCVEREMGLPTALPCSFATCASAQFQWGLKSWKWRCIFQVAILWINPIKKYSRAYFGVSIYRVVLGGCQLPIWNHVLSKMKSTFLRILPRASLSISTLCWTMLAGGVAWTLMGLFFSYWSQRKDSNLVIEILLVHLALQQNLLSYTVIALSSCQASWCSKYLTDLNLIWNQWGLHPIVSPTE